MTTMTSSSSPAYLGFDLSSQSLKCLAVTSGLKAIHEEAVNFDADLPQYNVQSGVHRNEAENEVYAPVAMWIEALDLILTRMKDGGFDFSRVRGLSGAGQQHGSVYWSNQAERILSSLDSQKCLVDQLSPEAFTHEWSPNWQDHSTQKQCEQFESAAGGADALARITGSRAHHRFTGPQILRFHQLRPGVYEKTERISLVSSFLCSVFLGRIAPLDISDVCGMNLWDIQKDDWSTPLLAQAAEGDKGGVEALKKKLGEVEMVHGKRLGSISSYFKERFGFDPDCAVYPFTGDNPSTILALPLRPLDAIVSLGTSTTLLMATPTYHPSVEYHLFNHPTTPGLYMFMLCYCNGALARNSIRDSVNKSSSSSSDPESWDVFNDAAFSGAPSPSSLPPTAQLGYYFPLPENIPNVQSGTWRFTYTLSSGDLSESSEKWNIPHDDPRAILDSQALSMRMRSAPLLATNNGQPRRLYMVGGGSKNPAITSAMADVLGGIEGVYKLDIGGNACALGAAYYATWAAERKEKEGFEDFVAERWDEKNRVEKMGEGYRQGVWEWYGKVLEGFREAEGKVIETAHN
ncbi:actin-like ATPase domain-containing protein [Ascodesmis nigricans]|uniref:Xylulose kinase n=1 Tax=Ascodesmis nigricans TaxID=341454 RepID=A0A4V3SJM9_9PEZI|nr:actin-like ATPase domain-containing protein [Ascodesmis nigricans]